MSRRPLAALAALCVAGAFAASPARADDQPAAPPGPPPPWVDGIKFSGHIEAGASVNPTGPTAGMNFGQLFTDRANQPMLNQALLTLERDLDPKNPNFDVGFKLQAMYGGDARYTHFLGELDQATRDRYQFDIVEANLTAHLPVLTDGGVDIKVGQYPTPLGAEVIDAAANPLYTHSYIFNFGLPFKHTGGMATIHATDVVDLWVGVDSGVNTSLGGGDNNGAPAFLAGVGLNLLDGNLTILALGHFGPENGAGPLNAGLPVNSSFREFYDAVIIWKATDKLTSTTELNLVHDDLFNATAEGVATYLSYTLTDQVTLQGRGEIFADNQGFFVYAFPNSLDFVNSEYGYPNHSFNFGQATYGEITLGVNWKPTMPKPFDGFVVRPELRVDDVLDGHPVFDNGRGSTQFTAAVDFILPF
jgi:hypothetical protein